MNIKIFDKTFDNVLQSDYFVAKLTIKDAYDYLVPIINRFSEQRYTLKSKVYEKLKVDIIKGCIMPPLTIAFKNNESIDDFEHFIKTHINEAFILDGIQRLNTIKRIYNDNIEIDDNLPIYLNILVSDSTDKLLYRMVTLNNGQKPMSTRHQIEILASNLYDFDSLPLLIRTEKFQKENGLEDYSFSKENIIKAYIAFLSNTHVVDNQKIIDEKLDELITSKIMESDLPNREIEFYDVISLIDSLIREDDFFYKWFSNNNNMIGFCSCINKIYKQIISEKDSLKNLCLKIEDAINYINKSKINLGSFRRKTINYIFSRFERYKDEDVNYILQDIGDL